MICEIESVVVCCGNIIILYHQSAGFRPFLSKHSVSPLGLLQQFFLLLRPVNVPINIQTQVLPQSRIRGQGVVGVFHLVRQRSAEIPHLLPVNPNPLRPYPLNRPQLHRHVLFGGELRWQALLELGQVPTGRAVYLPMNVVLGVTPVVEPALLRAEVQLSEVVIRSVVDVGCVRDRVLLS